MSESEVSSEREAAEIKRILAEANRAEAEARQANAVAREQELLARVRETEALKAEMEWDEKVMFRARELAKDKWNYHYRLNGGITEAAVRSAIDELTVWRRTAKTDQPIEIVFDSPGGSVIDGMDLFDFIQELKNDGHYVTTAARGYAASMGGILLQAGNRRIIGREAYVLIHQIRTGVAGKIGEIEDELKFVNKMSCRILNIFASRSAEAFANGTAEHALTAEQFAQGDSALGIPGWERKDWWLDSEECLRFGIVDEIRG